MNKLDKSEPHTRKQTILFSGVALCTVVAGVGCFGDQAHAMGKKAMQNRADRTTRMLLNEESPIWQHNLESEGIFARKFSAHTSTLDGRHLTSFFRAYTGSKGHRHLRLKLKLKVVIVPAVIEEEEFLFEDGSGFIYYDTAHSGSVDVVHVWKFPRR